MLLIVFVLKQSNKYPLTTSSNELFWFWYLLPECVIVGRHIYEYKYSLVSDSGSFPL